MSVAGPYPWVNPLRCGGLRRFQSFPVGVPPSGTAQVALHCRWPHAVFHSFKSATSASSFPLRCRLLHDHSSSLFPLSPSPPPTPVPRISCAVPALFGLIDSASWRPQSTPACLAGNYPCFYQALLRWVSCSSVTIVSCRSQYVTMQGQATNHYHSRGCNVWYYLGPRVQ